jgi:hypothetical protein
MVCYWRACLLVFALCAGCDQKQCGPDDTLGQQLRQTLYVEKQPESISSIRDGYDSFAEGQTITIAGRIYADGISPFDANEASFTIIELPKPGHNHEDPGDCPFCKREMKNAKFAIVKILDDQGSTIAQPADQLLDLIKNQDIVVTGPVSRVGETLIVQLQGLHLLSPGAAESLSKSFRQALQATGADTQSEQPLDQQPDASREVSGA